MLDFLGGLFTSVVGGGVTGILGVVVQRVADYKNKQLDMQIAKEKYAHETNMRKVDAEIMAQEWAGRTRVAEVEAEAKVDAADASAFQASFAEPTRATAPIKVTRGQAWVVVILDVIRGIVRPGLTVYLCVLTTLVYMQATALIGVDGIAALTSEQVLQLILKVVGTVLYLTTTCVLWWFGTRNKGAPVG